MRELSPHTRTLMGPGPSNVHPRVYKAMSTPLVGHLDPDFLSIMNDIQSMLRLLFKTSNPFTIAISGTGSAGMEASIINVVEPGDKVAVGVNGVFGTRLADVVQRTGGVCTEILADWGTAIDPGKVEDILKKNGPYKALAIVHGETSTGVHQPLEEISKICQSTNTLLIVDAVTTLGGVPVEVDQWNIDVCYSGTQKCLSCPPGLSPITFSPRALEVLEKRKTPVQSWYLDMSMIANYWKEGSRAYHHTAPISSNYALYESLRIVLEEGLEQRFQRHTEVHHMLMKGLKDLKIEPFVAEEIRLPQLNAVTIPEGINDKKVRERLLTEHNIEIGGGLGPMAGQIWRIGLMGETAQRKHVAALLDALKCVG